MATKKTGATYTERRSFSGGTSDQDPHVAHTKEVRQTRQGKLASGRPYLIQRRVEDTRIHDGRGGTFPSKSKSSSHAVYNKSKTKGESRMGLADRAKYESGRAGHKSNPAKHVQKFDVIGRSVKSRKVK